MVIPVSNSCSSSRPIRKLALRAIAGAASRRADGRGCRRPRAGRPRRAFCLKAAIRADLGPRVRPPRGRSRGGGQIGGGAACDRRSRSVSRCFPATTLADKVHRRMRAGEPEDDEAEHDRAAAAPPPFELVTPATARAASSVASAARASPGPGSAPRSVEVGPSPGTMRGQASRHRDLRGEPRHLDRALASAQPLGAKSPS